MKLKAKAKINAVDIAVIVLIVFVTVFACHRYLPKSGVSAKKCHIVYCLKVEGLSASFSDKISVGDKVLNFDDGAEIGTVSKISPDRPYGHTDESVLYVTVKSSAEDTDNGFLVNGTNISVGNRLQIRFPNLYCEAECIGAEADDS